MSGGPGLQFYNGQFLARSHPRIGSGVILEPQGFPNAPNEPRFPPASCDPERFIAPASNTGWRRHECRCQAGSGAAAQLLRKTAPVSFHGCMQDPGERAGSSGAWKTWRDRMQRFAQRP